MAVFGSPDSCCGTAGRLAWRLQHADIGSAQPSSFDDNPILYYVIILFIFDRCSTLYSSHYYCEMKSSPEKLALTYRRRGLRNEHGERLLGHCAAPERYFPRPQRLTLPILRLHPRTKFSVLHELDVPAAAGDTEGFLWKLMNWPNSRWTTLTNNKNLAIS